MTKEVLDEREFELINIIGAKLGSNQRDLSRHMDLSLGQTNMLIRRLVAKGYIRIRQLNKRKVSYLLTPKGFTEKMQKSIKYTINTINSIGLIRASLKKIILKLHEKGERHFVVLGKSDLVTLIEMTLNEVFIDNYTIVKITEISSHEINGVLLICQEEFEPGMPPIDNSINLLEELAKEKLLLNTKETNGRFLSQSGVK